MIKTMAVIENETKLLDTLSTMEVGSRIISTTVKDETGTALVDRRLKELRLEELVPLNHKSAEYLALQEYLINTAGHTHCMFHVITPLTRVRSNKPSDIKYHLEDIFRISRRGEQDRFNQYREANTKHRHRRLLWHGSRTSNFAGILSQGLRIAPPEAPPNGYMFGMEC